MIIPCIEQFDG